jgi:allantoicase
MKEGSTLLDIPLSDWAVLKLGKQASKGVARVIIDTKHFRGNFPESAMLEGCYDPEESSTAEWFTLIPRTRMSPDAEHVFERSMNQVENSDKPITHVRVSIYPDGGISRVRIYG